MTEAFDAKLNKNITVVKCIKKKSFIQELVSTLHSDKQYSMMKTEFNDANRIQLQMQL